MTVLRVATDIGRTGWVAIGTYAKIDGTPHMVDLVIVPGPMPPRLSDRPAGLKRRAWLHERGQSSHVDVDLNAQRALQTPPPRAIYNRVLRLIPLDEMQAEASRYSDELDELDDLEQAETAADAADLTTAQIRYLQAAVRFARAAATVEHPHLAVAADMGISRRELTSLLDSARRLGYLTRPGKGRQQGGDLTALGSALRQRYLDRKGRPQA